MYVLLLEVISSSFLGEKMLHCALHTGHKQTLDVAMVTMKMNEIRMVQTSVLWNAKTIRRLRGDSSLISAQEI